MQIVIDISEDDYRKTQDGRASVSMMRKAITNGTPLDKIRAEIEEIAKDYDKFADYRCVHGLWIALDIIDKYKAFLETVADMDILDSSPYLHQAMRVADKLICDPSSVQRTWEGTGKTDRGDGMNGEKAKKCVFDDNGRNCQEIRR